MLFFAIDLFYFVFVLPDLEHQKETALVDHIKIQLERQTLPPCKVEKLKQQLKDLETAEVELNRAVEENDFQFSLEEKAATRSEVGAPFLNRLCAICFMTWIFTSCDQ